MRTAVIVFLIATAVSVCNAQWVQTNGPYGDAVWNLAVSGTHLFAATDSGIFHSTNDGASWAAANTPFGDFCNIVQNGSNLFAGTSAAGVWFSTNNGESWTQVNTGITDTVIRALVVSGTNLFAGTADSGIFLSTDNGTNWTHVDSGLPNTSVWSIVVSGTNLFASTGAGVFLSTNNGINWTRTDSVMQVGKLRASGTKLFLMLTCYGCCPLASEESASRKILSSPVKHDDVSSIEVGTEGVYISTDSGKSWNYRGLYCSGLKALEVSDTNLFAGTFGGGVYLSTNNGTNWTAVNTGLADSSISSLVISGPYLFAGTYYDGVWKRPLSEMITSVEPTWGSLPKDFGLNQNYPNPFNPTTTINYHLPTQSPVTLKVFDVLGREVETLVNDVEPPGYKSVTFNASRLSSGIYFYRLQAGNFIETNKLVLLR